MRNIAKLAFGFILNLCRFILAFTLIFSGLVKANDPVGTTYKIQEYISPFVSLGDNVVVWFAGLLVLIEFLLGIGLLFGICKRMMSRAVFIFVLLMTLITVYVYVYNPISDCGCFGEALKLTNSQTLLKNIILLICASVVLVRPNWQTGFVSDHSSSLVLSYSALFISGVMMFCYLFLPVMDYSPFRIGSNLRETVSVPDSLRPVYDVKLHYKKGHDNIVIDLDDEEPDSTWEYVQTIRILKKSGKRPKVDNFFVTDSLSGEDLTDDIVYDDGYCFLLVSKDLGEANQNSVNQINSMAEYAQRNGYSFYCLTAGDSISSSRWAYETAAEYQICTSEENILKAMMHSNPGLILMHDGKIIKKWSTYNMPDATDQDKSIEELGWDKKGLQNAHRRKTLMMAALVLPLLCIFVIDRFARLMAYLRARRMKAKRSA